ncbi:unnamed protein product, partial [Meganyctiphanes norvegica]
MGDVPIISSYLPCAASIGHDRLIDNSSYWAERENILALEQTQILGQQIVLTPAEQKANEFVMKIKNDELQNAYETLEFPPSQNFMTVIDKIEASGIYDFIQKIQIGAGLHLHEIALWSVDMVVAELTYWDDLYMCTLADDLLMFSDNQILDCPCPWQFVNAAVAQSKLRSRFELMLFLRILSLAGSATAHETMPAITIWLAIWASYRSLRIVVAYGHKNVIYVLAVLIKFDQDVINFSKSGASLLGLYEKNGTELDDVATLTVYRDVAQKYADDHPGDFLGAKFIYAPIRKVDVETVEDYVKIAVEVKKALPDFIAGFDLVGQEDLGQPLKAFLDPLLSIAELGVDLKVFYHAGETNWMGMDTDENIIDALLLNASRIGHGYALVKHPRAKQLALEKNVPIEVCPISNQVLHLVSDLRNHPVAGLVAEGFPIVISADDPAAWGAKGLSHDFYEAFMALGGAAADLRFLKQLAINSIKYVIL